MVSSRYKMTGLKELRRNPPYSHAFAVLLELGFLARTVGVKERVRVWPAQHCFFDSNTSFILEKHETMWQKPVA